jgi:hypothetical protein
MLSKFNAAGLACSTRQPRQAKVKAALGPCRNKAVLLSARQAQGFDLFAGK